MSKTRGEGRAAAEKQSKVLTPAEVRRAKEKRQAEEEAEWAARSGPVTSTRAARRLTIDETTERFIDMLREVLAAEPPGPNPEAQESYLLAEVAMKHYEWERQVAALRLLIGVRLTNRALDDA